jgi:hypothetical protein
LNCLVKAGSHFAVSDASLSFMAPLDRRTLRAVRRFSRSEPNEVPYGGAAKG